jgi:hypothetical protein
MAYIGNTPASNFASVTKDTFSGDGSETAFTLSKAATTNGVAVFVENVRQEPTTAYSVSGTTLTFTAAPVSASGNNIYVLHHNTPASTATHPSAQALTATSGTFSSTLAVTGATTLSGGVSGDVAFDTSTLKIDSSNNRVGVGLTDPSDLFEVSNSADTPTRAIITAEDSSGSNQNAFIKTKAKGNYYNGLELVSTDGHVGFFGGYYSGGSATMQARVGGSGVNSSDVQAMVIDSNGHVTMPNQSAFLAYLSTEDENLTQGGAENKLPFQTERFDLNADYNTSTYTFTAPVTGKYQFNVSIRLDDMASNTTYNYTYFKTSNRTYTFWLASPADWNGSAFYSVNGSILADLDANDTCYIGYIGQGGTDQADHADGYFSGHLVA